MSDLRFSIILPVHVWNEYRQTTLVRAIKSIENQTFDHTKFELIIVNDGSSKEFKVESKPWIIVINKQHQERVIAYNAGLSLARGEIICLLDSDDEYEPNYLECVDWMFKTYPDYSMFNFGCRYIDLQGKPTGQRTAFKPKELEVGHEVFGRGNIVNGTFVFHRSVYDDLKAYPDDVIKDIDCREINYSQGIRDLHMWSPHDFAAAALMEFPELRPFIMVEKNGKICSKELGNPWGNDMYLFYKYTRKYHSKPLDEILYIVHTKIGVI